MDDTDSLSTLYSLDARLDALQALLEKRLPDSELATDYDVMTVWVADNAGAAVIPVSLPRTLRHVEIELAAPQISGACFLFDGPISVAQAAQQVSYPVAGGESGAIIATGGSKLKCRVYLGQSGILTLYFTSAGYQCVTLRVRSLDVVSRSKNTADVSNVEVGWE